MTNVASPAYQITSNGVITRWGYDFIDGSGSFPASLAVLRGASPNWTLIGSSELVPSVPGANTGATRLSVLAGDRIALANTIAYCVDAGQQGNYGPFTVGTPVGTALTLGSVSANVTPSVWAALEPDVDGDGFGDETQDLCPQGAAFQAACPVPVLSAFQLESATGFRAMATTSFNTTVVANGSVRLPATKGKKAKTLKFKSKPINTGPGKLTAITLKWPRSLTKTLASLRARSKLKVSVKLTADGPAADTTKNFTTRVKGRG